MTLRISVTDKGFELGGFKKPPSSVFVRWDDVDEVRTYKRDFFAFDSICLAFHTQDGWFECCEEDGHFEDLFAALKEHFPGVPASWYDEVMLPAFETNERTLWKR